MQILPIKFIILSQITAYEEHGDRETPTSNPDRAEAEISKRNKLCEEISQFYPDEITLSLRSDNQ